MKTKIFLFLTLFTLTLLQIFNIPNEHYDTLNPFKANQSGYNASEVITSFSIEMAMYYSWFASYAYCYDSNITSGNCCKNVTEKNNGWNLISHGAASSTTLDYNDANNYVIFRSDKYKKFVLAFPGTRKFRQLLEEINDRELVPIASNIKVMYYLYQLINGTIGNVFSSYNLGLFRAHKDYQVILTGHSLGGSTATLFAFMESYYKAYSFQNKNKIVLVTFGQNRVGDYHFAEYLESKVDIYRVIRDKDIVPHVPPCKQAHIFSSYCKKNEKKYVHAGKYYLMNKKLTTVAVCGDEYTKPSKECDNDIPFHDMIDVHTIYFGKEKLSERCK